MEKRDAPIQIPSEDSKATRKGRVARTLLYSAIAAVGSTFFGYGTASIAGGLAVFGLVRFGGFAFQDLALIALLVGAVLGAIAGGWMADLCGRRDTIMTTAALFALGSFVTGLAENLGWFVFGRILEGISVGVVSVAVPVYIAEIAPSRLRGRLVALTQLCITLGIFLAFAVSNLYAGGGENWRVIFMFGAGFALVLGVGMLLLPSSPRWLVWQADEPMAIEVFRSIRSFDPNSTIAAIRQNLKTAAEQPLSGRFYPGVRPSLLLTCALFGFQQLTGINVFLYLAPLWFHSIGFSRAFGSLLATTGFGLTNLIFTLAGMILIDRLGRRPLLILGFLGCGITLVGIAFLMSLPADHSSALRWAILLLYFLYVACFAVGPGLILWVYVGELFPLGARGKAASVPAAFHWLCNIGMLLLFLLFIRIGTRPQIIFFFGLFSLGGAYYSFRFAPETKNLTLEAIERFWLAGGLPWQLRGKKEDRFVHARKSN